MKIKIKVIPRASRNELIKISDTEWKVKLTAAPVEGKANQELIKFLAKELGIRKSEIGIVKGEKNREKMVEIK